MANETQRLWDLLTNRLTIARAGYLDELDFGLDERLGAPAGASLAADLATIDGVVDTLDTNLGDPSLDTLTTIAAKLGDPAQDLDTMIGYEGATSLADKLTATRAGYLDAGISTRSTHAPVDVRESVCTGTDPAGSIGRLLNDYLDKSIVALNDLAQADILSDATPFAGADIAAILADTANMQPKLGTPAGASISVDIADLDSDIAALNDLSAAQVNAEVDGALDTAIPVTPTADSLNERLAAIDDLTQSGGAGDLAAILTDTSNMQPKLGTPVTDIAADIADLITRTKGLDDIHDDLAAITAKGLGYGTAISGSVTPTDGLENDILATNGAGDYAQDFEVFLGIDVSVMQAGDTIEVKVYKTVDGTNERLADSQTLSDVQTIEVWEMDGLWGDEVQDIRVTLAQTAGTYRTFNYRGAVRKPA